MLKTGLIAGLLAACMSTPVMACSLGNWNIYENEPSIARLMREAATIDWISVEAGPVRCPRFSTVPGTAFVPDPACDYHQSQGDFTGMVVERLKGGSPDRFRLARRRASDYGVRWDDFSDPRDIDPANTGNWISTSPSAELRRIAERRHGDLEFWDAAYLPFVTDRADSCGGRPTLDPEMTYVVFRDRLGGVLALEPVNADDDVLLHRLRARRENPRAEMREIYPVETLFRTAAQLALATVKSCRGGGRDYESERAALILERGDPAFILEIQVSYDADEEGLSEGGVFRFDELWDSFDIRRERCPSAGTRVLLLRPSFGRPYDSPRVIRVQRNGTVRPSDIPTALRLTGPETITVEQAFAWFEEGRAASTPAPSSS